MFGFIWVLLEKIAVRILKQDIERWRDQMASWKDSVNMLEDKLDIRRSEMIRLKADHDREIESLQQTAREQAKCIEQQIETIRVLEKLQQESLDKEAKLQSRISGLNVKIAGLEKDRSNLREMMERAKGFLTY